MKKQGLLGVISMVGLAGLLIGCSTSKSNSTSMGNELAGCTCSADQPKYVACWAKSSGPGVIEDIGGGTGINDPLPGGEVVVPPSGDDTSASGGSSATDATSGAGGNDTTTNGGSSGTDATSGGAGSDTTSSGADDSGSAPGTGNGTGTGNGNGTGTGNGNGNGNGNGRCPSCPDAPGDNDCTPPETETGGCWFTGGGYIEDPDGKDSFGGNGKPFKDGSIRGQWQHVDHGTGNKLHGQVRYIVCRQVDEPGPGQPSGPNHDFKMNLVYYGGPGRWFDAAGQWSEGYWFDVVAKDHGEPGNKPGPGNHGSGGPDTYQITIRKLKAANVPGDVVYTTGGDFQGGNFQLHPSNPGHPDTASTAPAWVTVGP